MRNREKTGRVPRMHRRTITATVVVATGLAVSLAALVPAASAEPEYDHGKYLATMAEFFEVSNPPAVEVERWVLPEEKDEVHTACLKDRGVKFENDGVTWHAPAAERAAFNLSQYVCSAKFPKDPKYAKPWTEQQVAVQYDWTVNNLVPCLKEHGYDIKGVPSRAEFMRTFESAPFYPYSQIRPMENAAWAQLEKTCRQIAPSRMLFPD